VDLAEECRDGLTEFIFCFCGIETGSDLLRGGGKDTWRQKGKHLDVHEASPPPKPPYSLPMSPGLKRDDKGGGEVGIIPGVTTTRSFSSRSPFSAIARCITNLGDPSFRMRLYNTGVLGGEPIGSSNSSPSFATIMGLPPPLLAESAEPSVSPSDKGHEAGPSNAGCSKDGCSKDGCSKTGC
jgi:hypothetical protein